MTFQSFNSYQHVGISALISRTDFFRPANVALQWASTTTEWWALASQWRSQQIKLHQLLKWIQKLICTITLRRGRSYWMIVFGGRLKSIQRTTIMWSQFKLQVVWRTQVIFQEANSKLLWMILDLKVGRMELRTQLAQTDGRILKCRQRDRMIASFGGLEVTSSWTESERSILLF